MEHPYTIGQKLELIYKGQYLKAVIISLGSQSDNRKDGYFYARLSNGKRKLYNYDLNRVNWACNVIEYNEAQMNKTLSKQKRPLSKKQLAEYRFGVLEDGLHVLECQNQELTNEISELKDLIETLIESVEDQNVK